MFVQITSILPRGKNNVKKYFYCKIKVGRGRKMTENEREFQKMLGEISLEEKLKLLELLRTLTEGNENSQVPAAVGL